MFTDTVRLSRRHWLAAAGGSCGVGGGLLAESFFIAPGLRPLDVIWPYVLDFLQGGAPAASDSHPAGPAGGCEVDASAGEAC